MFQRPPTFAEIWQAQTRLRAYLAPTPLRLSLALSEQFGAEIYLKLENWQPTGSFKVRGAFNLLAQLTPDEIARGLVAASAGNHGSAVGYAARQLNMPNVHIFVPGNTPRAKVDKMKRFGVNVHKVGETYDDAHHAADAYMHSHNATFVHAYDDARTAAGAGTTALEIAAALPDADAVLIPLGGGGLASGMAIAFKHLAPHTRVIGIQPDASPSLHDSLRDNVCYEEYDAGPSICDGLAGGIGKIVFEIAQDRLIDHVSLVTEDAVHQAVVEFARSEQMIVEGAGAVGLAELMENPAPYRGKRVVLVVTGANIDAARLNELLTASQDGNAQIHSF